MSSQTHLCLLKLKNTSWSFLKRRCWGAHCPAMALLMLEDSVSALTPFTPGLEHCSPLAYCYAHILSGTYSPPRLSKWWLQPSHPHLSYHEWVSLTVLSGPTWQAQWEDSRRNQHLSWTLKIWWNASCLTVAGSSSRYSIGYKQRLCWG